MSDRWEVPPLPIGKTIRVPTASGGMALTDEEYNRRWFERLMKKTVVNKRGCFIWTGFLGKKGYIMLDHRARKCAGHRMVYMLTHKVDLSREQQVCHSCDERRCWNPGHLFLGTNQDNCKDMAAKKRHHLNRKTHCVNGHEFTPENTYSYVDKNGWNHRSCLTCDRERQRRAWHEKPEFRARQLEQRRRRRRAPPQPGDTHGQ